LYITTAHYAYNHLLDENDKKRYKEAVMVFNILKEVEIENFKMGLNKGDIQGFERGLEEGKNEGKKEGLEEGKKEGLEEGALRMIKQGLDQDIVKKTFELSDKKLSELLKKAGVKPKPKHKTINGRGKKR
jgi:flagellar biosynthesis/type III secretory pathway protein FliH